MQIQPDFIYTNLSKKIQRNMEYSISKNQRKRKQFFLKKKNVGFFYLHLFIKHNNFDRAYFSFAKCLQVLVV